MKKDVYSVEIYMKLGKRIWKTRFDAMQIAQCAWWKYISCFLFTIHKVRLYNLAFKSMNNIYCLIAFLHRILTSLSNLNFSSIVITNNFTSFSHEIFVRVNSINFSLTYLLVRGFINIHCNLDRGYLHDVFYEALHGTFSILF